MVPPVARPPLPAPPFPLVEPPVTFPPLPAPLLPPLPLLVPPLPLLAPPLPLFAPPLPLFAPPLPLFVPPLPLLAPPLPLLAPPLPLLPPVALLPPLPLLPPVAPPLPLLPPVEPPLPPDVPPFPCPPPPPVPEVAGASCAQETSETNASATIRRSDFFMRTSVRQCEREGLSIGDSPAVMEDQHENQRFGLGSDVRRLFATRMLRMFAYGLLSVVLVLHLTAAGLSESQIGLLLTLTLLGDTGISLFITTRADRAGRRRMLFIGAFLMVLAGVIFASTRSFWLLLLAATIGVISPSGNEVGPFLAVEQAALTQALPAHRRTSIFAWYNLVASFATAFGSLVGGALAEALQGNGVSALGSYRALACVYAAAGLGLAAVFSRLSTAVEARVAISGERPPRVPIFHLGLGNSRRKIFKLAGLFSMDAFAGGFVVQAFVAYWFQKRFAVSPSLLGSIFFGANILAGLSALTASRLAKRIGLLATMVATHIPSNLLLFMVPLMPSLPLAIAVLLLRFSISQMDVPTRQAYTMALVPEDERSAAAGVTGIARTVGAAISPIFAGPLYASAALAAVPFFLAGGIKIGYDLLVWRAFRKVKI